MTDKAAPQRAPFWRTLLVAWAILAAIGAMWSIATPIGGAPDEPAHLIKAASVVRGELVGTSVVGGQRVSVPEYIAFSEVESCFAFHPTTTPKCAPADSAKPETRLVPAVTSAGLYNPLYYVLVGWPSLIFTNSGGIYAMRIVSDVLVALFLAISFAFVALWSRRTIPLIGILTAFTPMVFFLGGSVNPNSLEIAATLAAFTGVLTVVRLPAREFLASRMLLVFLSASVAANMRGLSLLWVAIAVVAPLILATRNSLAELLKTRAVRLALMGTALACAFAAVWLLASNSLGIGSSGSTQLGGAPGVGTSHLLGFAWNLGSTFYYGQQIVGVFGWLDTVAPAAVYFVWAMLVGTFVLFGFAVLRRRALKFVAVLVAALLLLPPILQGIYITSGGIIWQGRYILPVFVCAVVGIAAVLSEAVNIPAAILRRLALFVTLVWAAAQVLAFATTLKRYAVGTKAGWPAILHPVWAPPGGVDAVLVVSVLVFLAAGIVAWRYGRRELPA